MSDESFLSKGASDFLDAYLRELLARFQSRLDRIEAHLSNDDDYVPAEVQWSAIAGRPATFPPEVHEHEFGALRNIPTAFPAEAHRHDWGQIDNKPAAFTPDIHSHDWDSIKGRPTAFPPEAHYQHWDTLTGVPDTFPPAPHTHNWSTLTGVPSDFPPAPHDHNWEDIRGVPTTFTPETHYHTFSSLRDVPTTFPPQQHSHSASEVRDAGALGVQLMQLATLAQADTLLGITRAPEDATSVTFYPGGTAQKAPVKIFTTSVLSTDGTWSVNYSTMGFTEVYIALPIAQMTGGALKDRVWANLEVGQPTLTSCSGRIMSADTAGLLAAMTSVAGAGRVFVMVIGR